MVAAPVFYSGVRVGEAHVEFDLTVLVDPVVRSNTQQLAAAAIAVVMFGVLAGTAFVALLVGPLRRLRVGVEQLSTGNLSVRVPPTSRDEVGELTRAFNEMGDSIQQKERIQTAFGRYVSDYVLSQLLERFRRRTAEWNRARSHGALRGHPPLHPSRGRAAGTACRFTAQRDLPIGDGPHPRLRRDGRQIHR